MFRVKICGVTTPADAELAARLGADALGLNFYPRSPRCLSDAQARAILNVLPASVEALGLFVNEPLHHVEREAARLGLRAVQLHGVHTEAVPAAPLRFVPAFSVRDAASLDAITAYLERLRAVGAVPAAVLVDAHVPGSHGGTGQTAPWHLLADFDPGVPLILAGGLTPENVAAAIRTVRPAGVDVASGVESTPGVKDAEKLRRFIAEALAALA